MKLTKSILHVVLLAGIATLAQGQLSIGFEASEGYTPGHLALQPDRANQWSLLRGSTNFLLVAQDAGVNGSAGLVSTATGGGANFVYYGYDTDVRRLGHPFSANDSLVTYSFQWRPNEAFDGEAGAILFKYAIGSDSIIGREAAVSFRIHASGRFQISDGDGWRTVDGLFWQTGKYYKISGEIDFAMKAATVFVDGFQQFDRQDGGWIPFHNPDSDNLNIRIGNLRGASDRALWREWALDDIQLEIRPR